MTSEQRDFLRKQIDAQMRERLESARMAKEQAKTQALEHQTIEGAVFAARASIPDDVDVVTGGGERIGEDHRRDALREARDEARLRARRRLQKVCDQGLQTRA
jgi:hypothetical protein